MGPRRFRCQPVRQIIILDSLDIKRHVFHITLNKNVFFSQDDYLSYTIDNFIEIAKYCLAEAHLQVEYLTENREFLNKYTLSLFVENVVHVNVSSNFEISQVRPVPISLKTHF